MTLEFTDITSPVDDREHSPLPTRSQPESRAVLPPSFRKIQETYDEDTEKQRWENEGGADPSRADYSDREHGSIDENPITQMVDDAYTYFDQDELDHAARAIDAAINQYVGCREVLRDLVEYAVARLSTAGGPAEPPHPAARPLVIKRRDLAI